MGGTPWKVVAPWRAELDAVLRDTRERVFRAGDYQPVGARTFASLDELDAFFMVEPDEDDEWD